MGNSKGSELLEVSNARTNPREVLLHSHQPDLKLARIKSNCSVSLG
jgi:hypothetical protein